MRFGPGLRVGASVVGTTALLTLAVGALPWLRDEDPAETVLRSRFFARGDDPAAVAALRRDLGIPTDPVAGTFGWVGRVLHGDLGTSWVSGKPVADTVLPALGVSGTLALAALAVAVLVAAALLAVPVWGATRTGRPLGRRVGAATAAIASVPEVVVAAVLVLLLAVRLRWLPPIGWGGADTLVLPALALGVPSGGLLARLAGTVVDQGLGEPWGTTWRVNGVPRTRVLASLLRRVAAAIAPQLVVVLVTVLGSAVAVEQVFAIPGAGSLAVEATLSQDLPVLQACLAGFLLAGLIAAALAGLINATLMRPTHRSLEAGDLHVLEAPRTRLTLLALGVLGLLAVAGIGRDGRSTDLPARLEAPSLAHPLGTDAVGHDLLGRLVHGSLLTLGIALGITVVAAAFGLAVGLLALGTGPGPTDVLLTVPSTVVGIAVASAVGPGLAGASAAVLAVAWIPLAVHSRTLVAQARAAGYVQAATLAGSTRARTLLVHVLPAVVPAVARHALVRVPAVALGIAGLSFIGLGADPDAAELGAMLAEGVRYLERAPWLVLGTGGVLALLAVVAGTARTDGRRGRS